MKAWDHHIRLKNESLFKNLKWRAVGPQFQGGRISSIVCPPGRNSTVYVGVGSGNVWKTINNGTTWEPIFENESTFAVGDMEISRSNPDIIWVGSGEEYQARSGFAGTGVFKSSDAGKTWRNMGLHDTQHIGRIVIDPRDPDIVYVAAIGHNYTFNEERGLFKTTDGGNTWNRVLFVSERAGAIDVVMDPSDHKTLYAATWERDRKAWTVVENGEGSGVYKTTDAGLTWKRCTRGFPVGEYVGRIGLDVSVSNPHVVYALVDNQTPLASAAPAARRRASSSLSVPQVEKMTKEEFLRIDPKLLGELLRNNQVPSEHSPQAVQEAVRTGELSLPDLASYILSYSERQRKFPPVMGAEVYRSDDKGETWKKVNESNLDFFYSTYGYYFGDVRVSPDDENEIYILGVRLLKSWDGGKTYQGVEGKMVHFYPHEATGLHLDQHELWIDPLNPDKLWLGNDGGLYVSYDRGKAWQHVNNLPITEFYNISVDMGSPYKIYGGTQDVASLYGPSSHNIEDAVDDPWKPIWLDPWSGGDGAYTLPDPTDLKTVIYYERGNIVQKNMESGSVKIYGRPQGKIGEPPLRWRQGRPPFLISHYNPNVLYYGANKLFKTLNRGDSWICISPDLTTNPGLEKQGNHSYFTISTISESPLKPGLIYAGTDDGNVHVTRNDGESWTKLNTGLPQKWVTRVLASRYEEGTVYVSLNGYAEDDFEKYLFMSTDLGQTWKSIAGNLPSEPINVIQEDPKKRNVLYVGTDLGVYLSIDRGTTWHSLCSHLPTTAVYDLVVHPWESDLVIGTHGRSCFILDVASIQAFDLNIQDKEAHLFETTPVRLPRIESASYAHASQRKAPEASIVYYLKKPQHATISVHDDSGKQIKELQGTNDAGINVATWDLTSDVGEESGARSAPAKNYVKPGDYTVEIRMGNRKLQGNIRVQAGKLYLSSLAGLRN